MAFPLKTGPTPHIHPPLMNVSCLMFVGATPIFRENLQFGTAVGPIFLDYLACTGSEEAIVNCSYVTGPLDCDHSMDDVGVQCLG